MDTPRLAIKIPNDGDLRGLREANDDTQLLRSALSAEADNLAARAFGDDFARLDALTSADDPTGQKLSEVLEGATASPEALAAYRQLKIASGAIRTLDTLERYLARDAEKDRRTSGDRREPLDPTLSRTGMSLELNEEETSLAIRGMGALASKDVSLVMGEDAEQHRIDGYYSAELLALKRAAQARLRELHGKVGANK